MVDRLVNLGNPDFVSILNSILLVLVLADDAHGPSIFSLLYEAVFNNIELLIEQDVAVNLLDNVIFDQD